jgi:hypothetical protein
MPETETLTLPRRCRTREEWIDLAAAVDTLDALPGPALWTDLLADGRGIIDQATRCALWAATVSAFFLTVEHYFQRHPPTEGPEGGP